MIDRDPKLAHISELLWNRLREVRHLIQHNMFLSLYAYIEVIEANPDVIDPSIIPSMLVSNIQESILFMMQDMQIPFPEEQGDGIKLLRYLLEDIWFSADADEKRNSRAYVATVIRQHMAKQNVRQGQPYRTYVG